MPQPILLQEESAAAFKIWHRNSNCFGKSSNFHSITTGTAVLTRLIAGTAVLLSTVNTN